MPRVHDMPAGNCLFCFFMKYWMENHYVNRNVKINDDDDNNNNINNNFFS